MELNVMKELNICKCIMMIVSTSRLIPTCQRPVWESSMAGYLPDTRPELMEEVRLFYWSSVVFFQFYETETI